MGILTKIKMIKNKKIKLSKKVNIINNLDKVAVMPPSLQMRNIIHNITN